MAKKRTKLFSLTRKDFIWSYFSGTGGGGQHRNKAKNSVRLSHKPSKVQVVCQDFRSKKQNERTALKRLANHPKFRKWLEIECAIISGDIARKVDEWMKPQNLKIETGESLGNCKNN